MNVAIEIPIKGRSSTRVPNKNFRELGGKPLSSWLLDNLIEFCPPEWDIFIDTEDEKVINYVKDLYTESRFKYHLRNQWFAQDAANGNHLVHQFAVNHPEYDLYIQLFVTAVTLKGEVIVEAVQTLINSQDTYDSVLLVTEDTGWFWFNGQAMNYNPHIPDGLPRSQDAMVYKETTGLYGITKDALFRTGCRVGNKPLFYKVDKEYALDIDNMDDFIEAQNILSQGF